MQTCNDNFYAHSNTALDKSDWQLLSDHLNNVAMIAGDYAEYFNAVQWSEILGENHDLGKGTLEWQAYLGHANDIIDEFSQHYSGHIPHAFCGAQWLYQHSGEAGKLLAYCIAGHHGGLPNWNDTGKSALKRRLQQQHPKIVIPHSIPKFPDRPPFPLSTDRIGFQLQFFTRMLFSCLVDADFLDTEASLDRKKSNWRSQYPAIHTLHEQFWSNFTKLREHADSTLKVNLQRERILRDCLHASELKPGFFSLTVPTGGGKTLASLAFALNHAKRYGKRRIIYVIPFTSIIEQNARIFRDMIGSGAVLEHHCNFMPDDSDWKTRLASENWDAPVIVTTNVQFFDSFYANKPSKCRKLHNVANSIVIFDEVQAIPVEKLKPCMEIIKELALHYGVTSVLCTATQPAIKFSDSFKSGLKDIREITGDIHGLFSELKRTEEVFAGEMSTQEIADKISDHDQVLCIVNTRQQALDIFNAVPESFDPVHLSALMYPAHRTRIINEIRQRLERKEPCRVVSTQLIEAGVDVDFPCVFRMVAGIDSIAQAAGRCNRNGLSETPKKVYVFAMPDAGSCSFFRLAAQSAEKLFQPYKGRLTDPDCVEEYFKDYFWKNEQRMDADGILEKCADAQSLDIQFKEIAEFRMIKSATEPVIIALEHDCIELVRSLEFAEHKKNILRKLQQFTVQIYPWQLTEIDAWLEQPLPGIRVLHSEELYSETTGLQCSSPEGEAFFV